MVDRCDFYSDEEYEYAKQMEYDEFQEALAREEEYAMYCEEEYRKEQALKQKESCEDGQAN